MGRRPLAGSGVGALGSHGIERVSEPKRQGRREKSSGAPVAPLAMLWRC